MIPPDPSCVIIFSLVCPHYITVINLSCEYNHTLSPMSPSSKSQATGVVLRTPDTPKEASTRLHGKTSIWRTLSGSLLHQAVTVPTLTFSSSGNRRMNGSLGEREQLRPRVHELRPSTLRLPIWQLGRMSVFAILKMQELRH